MNDDVVDRSRVEVIAEVLYGYLDPPDAREVAAGLDHELREWERQRPPTDAQIERVMAWMDAAGLTIAYSIDVAENDQLAQYESVKDALVAARDAETTE